MVDFASFVDILTTLSLAGGLLFAGVQWREGRRESHRQAQITVLRSFESPDFVRAMRAIMELPDDLSTDEIAARIGQAGVDLVWYWLGAMEGLGVLSFERHVDIRDVDQVYGGPIIVTFRKLRRHIDQVRAATGRESMHEWFQWLAEHVEQLEHDEGRPAAHVRERDWRP